MSKRRRARASATNHAVDRAVARTDVGRRGDARVGLELAWEHGVRLPWRYGRSLGRRTHRNVPKKQRAEYRLSGDVVMVRRGRSIVTCWRLDVDAAEIVEEWRATGIWRTDR